MNLPVSPRFDHAETDVQDTSWVDVIPAPGAGKRLKLHGLVSALDSTTGATMRFRWGTGDPFLPWRTVNQQRVVPMIFPVPCHLIGDANEALQVSLEAGAYAADELRVTAFYTTEG